MKNPINLAALNRKENGYIIGFYVGDGNIFIKQKKGIYRLRYFLGLNEKPVQKALLDILNKICKSIRTYKDEDNTFVIEIHSKQLIEFIQKTASKDGLKNISQDEDFLKGFVEGLIDSDGYVQRNYTEITTANSNLKKCLIKIAERFGIKPNIRTYTSSLSGRIGWRIGFSMNSQNFKPAKYF